MPGTEGAFRPFWSPDSQSLGFFADGKLKRIAISGAPLQTLAAVGYRPAGGSWSTSGVIVYADRSSQLYAVPEDGGEPAAATRLDVAAKETGHHAPYFLPDGKHFLFSAGSVDPKGGGVYVGALGSTERVRLFNAQQAQQVIYAEPGYLLYVRDNVLFAQRFDVGGLRVTGAPSVVPTTDVAQADGASRIGSISASGNGLLAFGGNRPQTHLTWFARDGRELGPLPVSPGIHNPMLSPDGHWLIGDGGNGLWLVDLDRGAPTRLVTDANLPSWTPDGRSVTFTSRRANDTASSLFIRSVGGEDDEQVLVSTTEMKISGNWSPDGRTLIYVSSNPETRLDLWTVTPGASAAPRPFLKSQANEFQPQISPDGRWVAYASDESGAWEVYVQAFPVAGSKRTISVGGGAQPQWRADGRELYYLAPDGTLMAVDVRSSNLLEAGKPKALFHARIQPDIISLRNQYTVGANGERFVIDAGSAPEPLNVVVNWTALVNP
jgi:eukaryotic-like serine/threonine-protein kinase